VKKIPVTLLTVLFLLSTITACKQQDVTKQQVQTKKISNHEITVKELQQKMAADSNIVILDVRTPQELNGPLGHINGVINIPVQVLEKNLDKIEKYKNHELYVICRSGHRSGIATKILSSKGFNPTNVLGGMIEYNKIKK